MSELSERLNQLKSRLEELENTPSELAKDALLADVRAFYDAVKNAEVTSAVQPVAEEPLQEPKGVEKTEEPELATEAEVEMPTAPVMTSVAEAEPEPTPELIVEKEEAPSPEPVAEATEEPTAKKSSMIGNAEDAPKANDEKILAGQLSRKPLEDLRTGIPLNEKFGIIRGLFKGNASDFGDAVLKLNNAATPSEMQHYLDLLKQRFGWDLESEAYQTFSVYVQRKMLTLETLDTDADQ